MTVANVSHKHLPPLPPRRYSRYSFLLDPDDLIGNLTHDLLVCSAVPQPTTPPSAPIDGEVGNGNACTIQVAFGVKMARTVSSWLHIAEAWVWSHDSSCETWAENRIYKGSPPSAYVFPCQYQPIDVPYSSLFSYCSQHKDERAKARNL